MSTAKAPSTSECLRSSLVSAGRIERNRLPWFVLLLLAVAAVWQGLRILPLPFSPFPSVDEPLVRIVPIEPVIIDSQLPQLRVLPNRPFKRMPTVEVTAISLVDGRKDIHDTGFTSQADGRGQLLTLLRPESYQPGKQVVNIEALVNGVPTKLQSSFHWGVVAVNVRQSEQVPGNLQELQLAVLDDFGRTECHSDITVRITDPLGARTIFRTSQHTVVRNPGCRDRSVTNEPDYRVYYTGQAVGSYRVDVSARTKDGVRKMTDHFQLSAETPLVIERSAFPTRIYPPAEYPVWFSVATEQPFRGLIRERVPTAFEIRDVTENGRAGFEGGQQFIEWSVDWKAGTRARLGYTFKAPSISPELYRLGPVELRGADGAVFGAETRSWLIAADAVKTWDGGGTTAAWSECANWNNDTCPANTGDSVLFDGTSNDNSDWDTGSSVTSVTGITASSMSGSITISQTTPTIAGGFSHTSTGNVIFSGSLAISVTGSFTLTTSGSFTANSSTLTMTGGIVNLDAPVTFNNLTVNPPAGGGTTIRNNSTTVSGALVVNDGLDSLTINTGLTVTHTGGTLTIGGSITGVGTLIMTDTSPGPGSGGTLSAKVRYDATNADIASTTFDARTYSAQVELYSNSASNRNVTFATGTYTFSGASSHLYLNANAAGNLTLTGATNDPTVNIGGDLDFTGTGGGSEAIATGGSVANTWTASGNVTFTDGTVTVETGNTWKMDGVGKTLTPAGQTLYNVNIDPASTGTISVSTSDLTISNALTVAANDTLSIDTSRTVTSSLTSGTALTLNGTISGGGEYIYSTTTTFPTAGTISSMLRLDVTAGSVSVPQRTFGGDVDIYSNAAATRTVTLGTAASQTLNFSGSLHLNTNSASPNHMTVTGATNSPAVNITGDLDYIGSGTANEALVTGGGIWTVSGNVTFTGGTFTASTNNVFVMNGTGGKQLAGGFSFVNLTIDPTSADTITIPSSSVVVSTTLTVAANDTLTLTSSATTLTLTRTSSTALTLNGTIDGAGRVTYNSSATFPSTGTISCVVRLSLNSAAIVIPPRSFGGDLEIFSGTSVSRSVTLSGAGTLAIGGQLLIIASSSGNATLDVTGPTPDVDVTVGGLLDFTGAGGGTEIITAGTGTWTVSGGVNFTSGQYNTAAGNTLEMNGSGTLTTGTVTLLNLTISGTITLASATHIVSGNLRLTGSTLTPGTSQINMTGTSNAISGGGQTLYNLNIDPGSAGTITLQDGDLNVSQTLTVAASDALSIDASRTLTLTGVSGSTLSLSGTISGAGRLTYKSSGAFPTTGTISSITRFDATGAVSMSVPGSRAFGGDVEFYSNVGSSKTITLGNGGSQTLTLSAHCYLIADGSGDLVIDSVTFSPTVAVTGNFDFTGTGGGAETWTGSTSNLSVGGNADMAGGVFTGGIAMIGTSNWINGAGNSISNLNIDPSSAGTITAQTGDILDVSTLTVATGDVLSIASGITITMYPTSPTLTINGSISGAGRLTWTSSASAFPAAGVVSSIVRFDMTNSSKTIPNRTPDPDFGGVVEFFSNSATFSSQTATLGSGAGQTISFASNVLIIADDNQAVNVDAAANNVTINITGNLDMTGVGSGDEMIATGTSPWTVSGSVDLTGCVFTATAGNLFKMNGTSKTLTSGGQSFKDFEVSGGSISTVDAADINGTFSVTSGSFTQGINVDMNVSGDFTLSNGTTFVGPTGSGILIFDGDLTATDNNVSLQNLGNVQVGASPDTVDLGSDMLYLSLTVKAGNFFYTNGYDITVGADFQVAGTFDATDDVETDESTMTVGGNVNIVSTATLNQDQSTLIMNGSSGTKDLITNGAFSFYNITINGGGSMFVEVEDPLDLDNNLTITNGTLDAKTGEDNAIVVGGNWDNDAAFEARSGSVTMNAGSGTKTIDTVGTGAYAFYDLTFNDGGGSATYQLTTQALIYDNLTISGGNFDANGNTITISGNWDNDDTFTSGTQTTYFYISSGTKTIDADGTGTDSFSTVEFDDSGGAGTWQLTTDMDVNGNLTLARGTVDFNGANTLSVAGNVANGGSITESTGTLVMDAGSGTKYLDVSGADSSGGAELNNLKFNDGGGTATYKLGYPLDANGNLTVTGGTFDMTGPTTWYLTNENRSAEDSNMNLSPIDPAGTADTSTACTDGAGFNTYCVLVPGQWSGLTLTGLPSTIQNTGWMLGNGQGLTGQTATGTWTVKATVDYYHDRCTYSTKQFFARLWKANPNLGSPTAITNWSSASTMADGLNDFTINFTSIAAQTFTNQVIYVEFATRLSGGTCGGSGDDTFVTLYVHEGAAKQQINTPALTMNLNVGGSWDNNDIFTHGSNKVVFDAGATGKTIEAGSSPFYNVDVSNASGGWTVQTDNMTVANDLNLIAGSSWTLASGRTLEVAGAYAQTIAGANTTWTGSTLYLNGSGGMYDIKAKTHGGDAYATFRVGASEDISDWDSSATTYTIDAGGCLFSQDHGGTSGRMGIFGTCNSRANEYWSYANDFDGTALGGSSRQANIQFDSGAALTVDNGDTLQILGQGAGANRSLVSRQSSGSYALTVNGTINARYYDFDYLDQNGLNITSTATVTELSDGSFDNAGTGLSSSYIKVTDITSTDEFDNNVFDDNGDGADGLVVYNVNGDGAAIDWNFTNATGNKAGESFDREVNGAIITWGTIPTLTLTLSDNLMDLGVVNAFAVNTDSHTITVTVNAAGGYSCSVVEDGNLRNGANDINDVSGGSVDAGNEEYGLNCSGGGCDLASDSAISGTPLTVASNSVPVTNEATTMVYKAAVTAATPALVYSHVVTYTCTADF